MIPNFYYDFGRSKTKFYITLPDLYAWAYKKYGETQEGEDYHDAKGLLDNCFQNAYSLFNGSLTYYDPQRLHKEDWITGEDHPPIIAYPTILTNSKDLINHYFEVYDNRPIFRPVEIGRFNPMDGVIMDYDMAMYTVLDEWCRVINRFVQFNKEKYLRLLQLLNLKYNPIDNYDGVELEEFDKDGTEQYSRVIDTKNVGYMRADGPASSATIGVDSEGNTTLSGSFDMNYYKKIEAGETGTNSEGAGLGTISEGSDGAISVTAGTGVAADAPTFTHYTSTYDDDTTGRYEYQDINTGKKGNSQKRLNTEAIPVNLEVQSGNPNAFGYTDTTSYDDRSDKRNLVKHGNMGTTMTQDMINKEREMLIEGWNIVGMFCEELNKEVFLQCYSY